MTGTLPQSADVVIVGGGIVGVSVAYHLAKRGIRPLLLERYQLTCGTTWHAAGLLGQLRSSANLTAMAQYTSNLYASLEAETGQATGYVRTGGISVAGSDERWRELKRNASIARGYGIEAELITAAEAKAHWPMIETKDIRGGLFLPGDGQTNPVDTTMSLARGARMHGAQILEGITVERILVERGEVRSIVTDRGEIRTTKLVNCAGLWAHDLAAANGVTLPLHAAEHFYVVTEPMAGLDPHRPVLRDPDRCAYFKEDAGKLLVGWFEPVAKPWGNGGVPADFAFGTLPDDFDHIEPLLSSAIERLPRLGETGIRTFFNGPESFTPDDRFLLGEAPEIRGYYVGAGFNSIGIQSAGGAGKVLADWITDGHPPMDLWDVDIARAVPFQANSSYLFDRTRETLGLLYAMHWPQRQFESARGARRSVLHDRLATTGAVFGEVAGWERANWFAPGTGASYTYGYDYADQNWFDATAAEHRAVREEVGLFDQSSFAKFVLEGPEAMLSLNRICTNQIDVEPGNVVYTQWLNHRGGIEADLTITRVDEERFLIVTAAATARRDFAWLKRHTAEARSVATDMSSGFTTLSVMGPRAREMLATLTSADLSNAAFPFGTSREIDIGYATVRATRITYVGELGWEIYISAEFAAHVYDRLVEAGAAFGLKHCGYHALDSLRMEKAYRHWGHDISDEDTPIEAGLGFAAKWDKPGGFIGREALIGQRGIAPAKRLVGLKLSERAAIYHNEPVYADGRLCGRVTSGAFGHHLGAPLALAYLRHDNGVTADWLKNVHFEVEVAGERITALPTLKPFYDPEGARVRG